MNETKTDEKNTTEVAVRVEYEGHLMTVEMLDTMTREVLTKESGTIPHQDFIDALSELDHAFAEHMELMDIPAGRLHVYGLQKKETQTGYGFVFKAILTCPGTRAEMKLKSPLLVAPNVAGFFDMEDDDGWPLHDKEDYRNILDDDEVELCNKVLDEAYAYAVEGKKGSDGQLDLFDQTETVQESNLLEDRSHEQLIPPPDFI